MTDRMRVVVADDHPIVRAGIVAVLVAEPDIVVVGEAADGSEALQLCRELVPDILLLDLNMPGMSPLELIEKLHEECPTIGVVVLTAYDDDAYIRGFIEAGAGGYLLKEEATANVAGAIRAVAQGGSWFSRSVLEKLAVPVQTPPAEGSVGALTRREREVLELIARGRSNAQIAQELHLAEQTIRNYTSRIYSKLGVGSRTEAVIWARNEGLLQ